MSRNIYQHKPTKEEVLEAAENATAFTSRWDGVEKRQYRGATASDVAERIYVNHHGQVVTHTYESRTSVLRKGVAISTVKKHLATLADEGALTAVSGDHWSIQGQHGSSKSATYYLGREACGLALEKEVARAATKREQAAQKAAEAYVLAEHADEVKAKWESLLAAHKPATPTFPDYTKDL